MVIISWKFKTLNTFEKSFPWGSSDTNYDKILWNTTYTGPPRLRYLCQVVQTQTTIAYRRILSALDPHIWDIFFKYSRHKSWQLIVEYYLHWTTTLRYLFQVVQTQTTTAYCRILPTLHATTFEVLIIIFFLWRNDLFSYRQNIKAQWVSNGE